MLESNSYYFIKVILVLSTFYYEENAREKTFQQHCKTL